MNKSTDLSSISIPKTFHSTFLHVTKQILLPFVNSSKEISNPIWPFFGIPPINCESFNAFTRTLGPSLLRLLHSIFQTKDICVVRRKLKLFPRSRPDPSTQNWQQQFSTGNRGIPTQSSSRCIHSARRRLFFNNYANSPSSAHSKVQLLLHQAKRDELVREFTYYTYCSCFDLTYIQHGFESS